MSLIFSGTESECNTRQEEFRVQLKDAQITPVSGKNQGKNYFKVVFYLASF